jgi:hypothetical protein
MGDKKNARMRRRNYKEKKRTGENMRKKLVCKNNKNEEN